MKLDLHKINIRGLEWGEKTTVKDGVLYVNRDEAIASVSYTHLDNTEKDILA